MVLASLFGFSLVLPSLYTRLDKLVSIDDTYQAIPFEEVYDKKYFVQALSELGVQVVLRPRNRKELTKHEIMFNSEWNGQQQSLGQIQKRFEPLVGEQNIIVQLDKLFGLTDTLDCDFHRLKFGALAALHFNTKITQSADFIISQIRNVTSFGQEGVWGRYQAVHLRVEPDAQAHTQYTHNIHITHHNTDAVHNAHIQYTYNTHTIHIYTQAFWGGKIWQGSSG